MLLVNWGVALERVQRRHPAQTESKLSAHKYIKYKGWEHVRKPAVVHQVRSRHFRLHEELKKRCAEKQAELAGKRGYENNCTFSGLFISLFLAECATCMNILSYKRINFTKIPLYGSVLIGCHSPWLNINVGRFSKSNLWATLSGELEISTRKWNSSTVLFWLARCLSVFIRISLVNYFSFDSIFSPGVA